jgi:pilus assembly protein Flp/PilA
MGMEIANDLFNLPFSVFINTAATNVSLDFRAIRPDVPTGVFLMWLLVSRFFSDESGATAIEYCLIATGIAFAIIATVQGIGPQLNTKFTSINTSLK